MLYITILNPMMMYRSRMGKNLDEITLSYVSSISDDAEIIFYDIVGSQAHSIMLYENKIITKTEVSKILHALEKLKKEKFEKKSDFEDIHELIESLVIKSAGLVSGGKMHTARSRNDQVSLDIRMKIRDDINTLCQCLLDTIEALVSLAQAHQKTVMPLYTHLQPAQVGVFSHYLLAYADALFRDVDRLYVTYGRVNENPLGAGPIGGTSIPIDRQSTAKMLGFHGIVENSIDATSTRDFVAEYVAAVALLMTITINKEKMKKSTESSYLIALDLAEKLVQKGTPFRTAHKVIGQLVQIASISKKPLSKITPSEVKTSVKGTNVDSKFLLKLINSTTIDSSLRDRTSQGSSGILEQKRMIVDRMKKIKMYREGTTKRENQVMTTFENLSKKVKLLIK